MTNLLIQGSSYLCSHTQVFNPVQSEISGLEFKVYHNGKLSPTTEVKTVKNNLTYLLK